MGGNTTETIAESNVSEDVVVPIMPAIVTAAREASFCTGAVIQRIIDSDDQLVHEQLRPKLKDPIVAELSRWPKLRPMIVSGVPPEGAMLGGCMWETTLLSNEKTPAAVPCKPEIERRVNGWAMLISSLLKSRHETEVCELQLVVPQVSLKTSCIVGV